MSLLAKLMFLPYKYSDVLLKKSSLFEVVLCETSSSGFFVYESFF